MSVTFAHAIRRAMNRGQSCYYCGVVLSRVQGAGRLGPQAWTRDHVVPRAHGRTLLANRVYACAWCNQLKDNRTKEEFRSFLIECGPANWDGLFAAEKSAQLATAHGFEGSLEELRKSAEGIGAMLWFGPVSVYWEDCRYTFQRRIGTG